MRYLRIKFRRITRFLTTLHVPLPNRSIVRIVFLSPSAQLGGAERVLIDAVCSLRSLLDEGDELHVVLMSNGPLDAAMRDAGAIVHLLHMPPTLAGVGESAAAKSVGGRGANALRMLRAAWAVSAYVRRLRKLLRRIGPDLIHSNGIKSHVLSGWMQPRRAMRPKLVWHIHDFLGARPIAARRLRKFSPRVSRLIAVSPAIARDCASTLPDVATDLVLNGIDVEHFSPAAEAVDRADRSVRVGLIATYARWKGQDLFIDAAAIAKRNSSVVLRFVIVGSPIYQTRGSQFSREELEQRAAVAGLTADDLEFVDFLPDPVAMVRSLDVVVHASTKPEPFGRTIAEAMACGKAVIVARDGGAAELFTESVDAVGFPPRDVQGLADAIVALANDPARRARLGQAARQTATANFDRRRFGRELLAVYRDLLT